MEVDKLCICDWNEMEQLYKITNALHQIMNCPTLACALYSLLKTDTNKANAAILTHLNKIPLYANHRVIVIEVYRMINEYRSSDCKEDILNILNRIIQMSS